jgi:hypothetical protein
MKILSINAEHTKNRSRIAFNMDESPSALLDQLEYGVLRFECAEGSTVLTVTVPRDAPDIDTSTVANIESKLRTIINDRKAKQAQTERIHRSELEMIANYTSLTIDRA